MASSTIGPGSIRRASSIKREEKRLENSRDSIICVGQSAAPVPKNKSFIIIVTPKNIIYNIILYKMKKFNKNSFKLVFKSEVDRIRIIKNAQHLLGILD
jgi:hypothetical protein